MWASVTFSSDNWQIGDGGGGMEVQWSGVEFYAKHRHDCQTYGLVAAAIENSRH
jgi:hypothetical protein